MTAPRSYPIGIVAFVTVHDDGTVTWDIDTSEARDGMREIEPQYIDMYDEHGSLIEVTDELIDADIERVEKANLAPWVRTPGSDTFHAVVLLTVRPGVTANALRTIVTDLLPEHLSASPSVHASIDAFLKRDSTTPIPADGGRVAVSIDLPGDTNLEGIPSRIEAALPDSDVAIYPSPWAVQVAVDTGALSR